MIIDNLIKSISTLPGLGKRSATRIVLYLLGKNRKMLKYINAEISNALELVVQCVSCGNISESSPCSICSNMNRSTHQVCIVSSVEDLWAIEASNNYKGLYYVLGFTDNNFNNSEDGEVDAQKLMKRFEDESVTEVILANSTTVSGQTISFYVSNVIKQTNPKVKITTLGRGIPIGSDIDYLDQNTIAAAFSSRVSVDEE